MLGQRDGRVVLRDSEDRVLLPACVADQEGSPDRGRRVDRRPVQPAPPALLTPSDHPGGLRTAILTTDRGPSKSRITRVHETGAGPDWWPAIKAAITTATPTPDLRATAASRNTKDTALLIPQPQPTNDGGCGGFVPANAGRASAARSTLPD